MSHKVLYIHHGAVPGGAPTSLKNMVDGVAQDKDFSCEISCVWPEMVAFFSSLPETEVTLYPKTGLFSGRVFMGWSRGISLRRIFAFLAEMCRSPFYIWREVRFLKGKAPSIVHLNSSILWMSAIAAKMCRIPIVWHIREASDDSDYNLIRIAYAWFVRKMAAAVVCIGPQEYSKMSGERSRKVMTIYNSLDEEFFSPEAYDRKALRQELGLPGDAYLYVSLGGFSFRKGTYQFIEALQHLPESYAAVLVGEFPFGEDPSIKGLNVRIAHGLEDKMVGRGLKKYFSWNYKERVAGLLGRIDGDRLFPIGVVDDVKPYLRACDVLVFTGTTPHSARPVYEAWALKKPVIAFSTEVMLRDIDDGVDGILVGDHTAEALADAVTRLQDNPELAVRMGQTGYQKAKDRFSKPSNNRRIISLYKEILSENSI